MEGVAWISPLPVTQADAVVIGAGAFGLSVAYQLAALGAGRVVVLDRFAPGTQTSPRAAGLYKLDSSRRDPHPAWRSSSIEAIRGFSAKPPGFHCSFVAVRKSFWPPAQQITRRSSTRKPRPPASWGVELETVDARGCSTASRPISPDAASALHTTCPVISTSRSLAPYSRPTRRRSAELGSLVIGETPVTGILVHNGEIAGVTTPRGDIVTPLVIDAAGAWARGVGALAGVEVPVAPVRHQLLITRPIAGMSPQEPIARIVDASAYLRPARGGLMMGGMESDPIAIDPRHDPEFSIPDTPLDMRVLDDLTAALGPLVPALGDTPIAEHRGGLFTMTPDARFLAGPVPGVHGLWTATGCNGSGFSISAGIGRALAEWIVGGEPSDSICSEPRPWTLWSRSPRWTPNVTSSRALAVRELLHTATRGLRSRVEYLVGRYESDFEQTFGASSTGRHGGTRSRIGVYE